MSQWEERKDELIRKLEKSKMTFRDILEQDKDYLVFGLQDREELEALIQRNDKVLNKLKKGEFTVAIVGLEKAGKSTLGNALLKNIFLPEYTERCTYTTTEIKAGSEDRGEIVFYSHEDFQTNFQKMMAELGYEGSATINMPVETFNSWWDTMADKDRRAYDQLNGTIAEDVRAILAGHKIIQSFLGQPARTFIGAEALKSRDFQIFITGISGYDEAGAVIRSAHPYAVKKVNIESANLGDMSHIVLYDVPGFDSPTDLHKKQTAAMLKEADAIIVVTNVGDRPNLVSTQLDMLHKERDADNVPLSAKAFVFGNKIDIVGSAQVAERNMAALRKDVAKYRIASADHVVCGSAKVFLEGLGVMSEDEGRRGGEPIKPKFEAWGLPDGDGVTVLRDKMTAYYRKDRYEILERRATNTLNDAEKLVHEILENNAEAARGTAYATRAGGAQMLALRRALERFVEEAKVIGDAYNERVLGEQPFSRIITEHIEEIYPAIDNEFVRRTELRAKIGIGALSNIERLNPLVREDLQVEFSKEIVQRTAVETGTLEQEIYDRLTEKFLEVAGTSAQSPYYEELKESVRTLFDEVLRTHDGEYCRFNTLVERFTTDPIEALIKYVFAGGDDSRLQKLIERHTLSQFYALAAYYTDSAEDGDALDVNDNTHLLRMFSRILAHEDFAVHEEAENEETIKNFIADHWEHIRMGASIAMELLPAGKWAKALSKAGIKLAGETDFDKKAKKAFENLFYQAGWQKKTPEEQREAVDACIGELCRQAPQPRQCTRRELLQQFSRRGHEKKQRQLDEITQQYAQDEERNAARKAQMIEEINEDIAILRDITVHAVMDAINLEKAFVSVITNNINLIRDHFKEEHENRIDTWINMYVDKIKADAFAQIQRDEMDALTRRNIVEAAQKLLVEFDRVEV